MSSPDVTLATPNLANKVSWTALDELGSDHRPIIIEVNNDFAQRHPQKKRRARWKRSRVEWKKFTASVESTLEATEQQDHPPMGLRLKNLNEAMLKAGHQHVGKTHPRGNTCWMNPTVRAAIKRRNQLRRQVRQKRTEWLEACHEVQVLMNEAKQRAWEDYLAEVEYRTDPTDMWRLIKSISGTPDSTAPNEALIVGGKIITTNPKKSDTFARHYARVSELNSRKRNGQETEDSRK